MLRQSSIVTQRLHSNNLDGTIVDFSRLKSLHPLVISAILAGSLAPSATSWANALGENVSWQFRTSTDKVNQAWLEEMRQKKMNGAYAAPVYNTYIDRQFNCANNATATANDNYSAMTGNSPSSAGNAPSAVGNLNSSSIGLGGGSASANINDDLLNKGRVSSSAEGDVDVSVKGDTSQVLNNDQVNSGDQSATLNGSTACQFGPLN